MKHLFPSPIAHLSNTRESLMVTDFSQKILLYESVGTVASMQRDFPLYSSYCAQWSEHTHGMHAFARKYLSRCS